MHFVLKHGPDCGAIRTSWRLLCTVWHKLSNKRKIPALLWGIAISLFSGNRIFASSPNPEGHPIEQAVVLDKIDTAGVSLSSVSHPVTIYVDPNESLTVKTVVKVFAGDVGRVTGNQPRVVSQPTVPPSEDLLIVGVQGSSKLIEALGKHGRLDLRPIRGKWEAAILQTVDNPLPRVRRAVIVAGSDRRGTAFALFSLSRAFGVSPWNWWADVPVKKHQEIRIKPGNFEQDEPSVQYRGLFLNDEEFGVLPWASSEMDPDRHNFGPHFYNKLFELMLRLHANSVWPAMHSGSRPFNADPENRKIANKWGIVMGSSHSEILLRNNVGEWDTNKDGPWNFQKNPERMKEYWATRLKENGSYENFYTVGLRGRHDSPLEAEGSPEVKAELVSAAISDQRRLLQHYVSRDLSKVPQVIWLYKEALDLYRIGINVPDDVTLGWVDDNYGYIRELPDSQEQRRSGGSGMYYHLSYRGDPNDYLWLCTTPPSLIQEEMTKAFEHGVRKYWVLNVGDLKPAEMDTDFFFQLAWDEPDVATLTQSQFIEQWMSEQFPDVDARALTKAMNEYYRLNFVRRPESMGFNGKNGPIHRTDFNPLAWGDQNRERATQWNDLVKNVSVLAKTIPPASRDAWFQLIQYPVQAAGALNQKVLSTDRTYLDVYERKAEALAIDSGLAAQAYRRIQDLTTEYNAMGNGKWHGMMSASPNNKDVFSKPRTATIADATTALPGSWRAFDGYDQPPVGESKFIEVEKSVSINAAHYAATHSEGNGTWQTLPNLGISGASVRFVSRQRDTSFAPGQAWLEYSFATSSDDEAELAIHILPTFALDSQHHLRFAVSVDQGPFRTLDAKQMGEWREATDPAARTWMGNVVRNSAVLAFALGKLEPGTHEVRISAVDPGVVFSHLVLTFPGAPPAYPAPPETTHELLMQLANKPSTRKP